MKNSQFVKDPQLANTTNQGCQYCTEGRFNLVDEMKYFDIGLYHCTVSKLPLFYKYIKLNIIIILKQTILVV